MPPAPAPCAASTQALADQRVRSWTEAPCQRRDGRSSRGEHGSVLERAWQAVWKQTANSGVPFAQAAMRKLSTNSVVVRLAGQPPHRGSELERDEQLCGQEAAVPEAPNAVGLAIGPGQLRGRAISWTGESTQLRCATVRLGNRRTVHLLVERLGETGWDWHVWGQAGWTWARYGLAETAEQAEQALVGLMRCSTNDNAPLGPNCQFVLFPQRSA